MRRAILTSLVLLPVLARAQASTSTESKSFATSAGLQAELTQPSGLAEVAMAAAAPAMIVPSAAGHAVLRETIQTRLTGDFTDAALRQAGTLEYSMKSTPTEASAPTVTRSVEIALTPEELANQPALSSVVVRAVVDEYGIPRDLTIAQSAGPVVDKKALAAVSQYRFKPATQDNQPTWASVTIAIKLQK